MIKRIFVFVLALICVFLLFSCEKNISASDFMTDFAAAYPLEGEIYFSEAQKKDEGYISEELFRKIYRIDGEIPEENHKTLILCKPVKKLTGFFLHWTDGFIIMVSKGGIYYGTF